MTLKKETVLIVTPGNRRTGSAGKRTWRYIQGVEFERADFEAARKIYETAKKCLITAKSDVQ